MRPPNIVQDACNPCSIRMLTRQMQRYNPVLQVCQGGDHGMIYVEKNALIIRNMEEKDAAQIAEAERAQGWLGNLEEKYRQRLKDQARGACIALVAECNREAVGYINVYPDSRWGSFGGMGYPEIVDFGVLEKYRCRGFGSALMDAAEAIASTYAAVVYLGVGLHSGYGSAQRMYARRGYIPDGSGVWYKDMICEPYSACWNDDDLVLYLYKELHAPAP